MNVSAQVFFSRVKAALPEDQVQLSAIIQSTYLYQSLGRIIFSFNI